MGLDEMKTYNVRSQTEIFLSHKLELMAIMVCERGYILAKMEKIEDCLSSVYTIMMATADIAKGYSKLDYVNFDVEIMKMSQMFSNNSRSVSFGEIFQILEAVLRGDDLKKFKHLQAHFNHHE
jgi:hypothetical protein